jgi:hypothetical protein
MNRVILVKRNLQKQQHHDHFTWTSQKCELRSTKGRPKGFYVLEIENFVNHLTSR